MRVFVAMLVAAVEAAQNQQTFLQMGLRTHRVKADVEEKKNDDDDFVYGEDGFSDAAMDSETLGAHEFIEAEDDSQIDEGDADDPGLAKSVADDEMTNFGEDGDGQEVEFKEADADYEYGHIDDEEEED